MVVDDGMRMRMLRILGGFCIRDRSASLRAGY